MPSATTARRTCTTRLRLSFSSSSSYAPRGHRYAPRGHRYAPRGHRYAIGTRREAIGPRREALGTRREAIGTRREAIGTSRTRTTFARTTVWAQQCETADDHTSAAAPKTLSPGSMGRPGGWVQGLRPGQEAGSRVYGPAERLGPGSMAGWEAGSKVYTGPS
jgi:hypothetical protein